MSIPSILPDLVDPNDNTVLVVLDRGIASSITVERARTLLATEGPTGPKGRPGYTGSAGAPVGYTGSAGSAGPQGPAGGYTGSRGFIGSNGYTGSGGDRGSAGYIGSVGHIGSSGYVGSIGFTGSVGYTGSRGSDGTSVNILGSYTNMAALQAAHPTGSLGDAYILTSSGHLAVWNGSVWVDVGSIQGPIGYIGSVGSVGYIGSVGYVGSKGYTGSSGYTGSNGYTGSTGYFGSVGYTGSASTQIGYTGSAGEVTGGVLGGSNFVIVTSNTTATNGDKLIANTSGGSFTIDLPATPDLGSSLIIIDGDNWSTNNLILGNNGSTIEGVLDSVTVDIGNSMLTLAYDGTTWQVFLTGAASASTTSASSVDIVNDTTSTTLYPTMVDGSGSAKTVKITSSNLYFNPTSGTLNAFNFNSFSDETLKSNVIKIENGLDIVNRLNPVSFNWTSTNEKAYGVLAQEIKEILPEIVSVNNQGLHTISYMQLIAILVSAVQKISKDIELLKKQ